MNPVETAPPWLLRPLPANAAADAALHAQIDRLASSLPQGLEALHQALDAVRTFTEYDAAVNHAAEHVWRAWEAFYQADDRELRTQLLAFAVAHLPESARARVCRRLAKDPSRTVRGRARRLVESGEIREVALPRSPATPWDATGWLSGIGAGPLTRHPQGRQAQEAHGVPPLATIAELRGLLGIRSPQQLGYFLLATDLDNGPYTRFTIPKRDGSAREICAPRNQLRWVQRQILKKILAGIPVHDAAHGFVTGRSTVTNAARHQGAKIVLKFDLKDFFPTIHYYRLVGLFGSLGYGVGDTRFSTIDDSRQVAPTLARLCCHTADPHAWGQARMPQGAPTSPALSNLVCRGLDARLTGLATRTGAVYTRYADDLTFSFKAPGVDLGRFRWWVDQICHQEGFLIHQSKFRVIRAAQRQVVTGIVVNDVLRVPREERRRFRAMLQNCRLHGVSSQARGRPDFAAYLRGFASYIHMVHPDEGARLLKEVDELLGPDTSGGVP
jgi:RNA-directed DNA polymerase